MRGKTGGGQESTSPVWWLRGGQQVTLRGEFHVLVGHSPASLLWLLPPGQLFSSPSMPLWEKCLKEWTSLTSTPKRSIADQMDLYDNVLAASSQPSESSTSSSESPPESHHEQSLKLNSKSLSCKPTVDYIITELLFVGQLPIVGSFS